MTTIDNVLEQRGNRYGEYMDVSDKSQQMKDLFRAAPSWQTMDSDMRESLDLIANKLSRIINGDPYYDDSWRDISGYATLVLQRLEKL
jgi:hypothetical protein